MSAVLVLYLHNIKHVRWFMDNGANNSWKSSGFYVVYQMFSAINDNQNSRENWFFSRSYVCLKTNKRKTVFRKKNCLFIVLFSIRKQIKVIFLYCRATVTPK